MEIKLDLDKDINENANSYYEKAKKLKSKLPGLEKAIEETNKEINEFESRKEKYLQRKEKQKIIQQHKKKHWYEKFRYTFTSSNLLFVCGTDASTNETLIKKHLEEKEDIVLHSQAPGSPFGIVKGGRGNISKDEIFEVAQFLLAFSKQWKRGFGDADAFWMYPEQLTKEAPSGEFMSKGSFMVYGEKNFIKNVPLRICLGIIKKKITTEEGEELEYQEPFSGSERACQQFCGNKYIKLEPGSLNYKALNKEIKKKLGAQIDDLPKYIPNNCRILKK